MVMRIVLCIVLGTVSAVAVVPGGRQLGAQTAQLTIESPLLVGVVGEVALSRTHIVFSYAGDLWSVSRTGGRAERLTEDSAEDIFPVFSPDGLWLAFARGAAADVDVYVMAAKGGTARRLTYFPKPDVPVGWTTDGLEIDRGSYRFARIVRSPHFSAASGLLNAPLDQPGVDVREGDYLIAVDGQPADLSKNAYAFFEGKVNQPTQITVSSKPTGGPARTYTVVPIAGTGALRNQDRGEANRRRVEELSGGKLAYVYIGAYDGRGIDDFTRGLIGMSEKQGLIIDQRNNGGGTTSDALIEALNRKQIYEYAYRYGDGFPTPPVTFAGPKVLITNEQNFSAAETFALMFKLTRTGTIVGQRTGGGGIGAALFQPSLVDGGRIAVPNRAAYNPAGSWDIENHGVTPDVEVEVLPRDWRDGHDAQLEKAVQVALDLLKKHKPSPDRRPSYPVHK